MGIVLILLSFLLTKIILNPVSKLLLNNGAVRENYLGKKIPIGLGLVIWLGTTPYLLIYGIINSEKNIFFILLILTTTLLVGFIDDLLGNHKIKGLKGHFLMFIRDKELTSGVLKALLISLFSLLFSYQISQNILLLIINFIILILTTNSFNLLDVRPGRTLKVFIFASILLSIFYPASRLFLSIIIASIIAYVPVDFKGKGMLGDTGSNFLGMSMGIVLISNLSNIVKIMVMIFLVYLHIFTEKQSLTALIDKVYFLRLIDNFGR